MNRPLFLALALALSVQAGAIAGANAAEGKRPSTVSLDIQSQPLGTALNAFAQQSGLRVIFFSDLGKGLTSPGLSGTFSPENALNRLLANTPLAYEFVDERTVAIKALTEGAATSSTDVRPQSAGEEMRLAQSAQQSGTDQQRSAAEASEETGKAGVQEIIVTAQKRSERLQEVPVPVAVIDAQSLVDMNQLRLRDYFNKIPALSLMPGTRGESFLALRGITTGSYTNPVVGVVVDDVPYGSSTRRGIGGSAPDIDPSDLAQIEVLRGPQGTLYGASNMGGLIKFVTVDPSFDRVSGRVQAGFSSVANGNDMGYGVRAGVNAPLSDTWAIRASGFMRQDPGYIDNVRYGDRAINSGDADGGRLSALWRPSDRFSLKLAAMMQNVRNDGSSYVTLGLGDLENNALRDTGWLKRTSEVYSATINAKLGRADLVSVTGYSVNTMNSSLDFPSLNALSQQQFGVGASALVNDIHTRKWTQELRLSLPLGERVDWRVGLFYTDEDTFYTDIISANNPSTGAPVGRWLDGPYWATFKESAIFSDVTVRMTERFDVQLGGRYSDSKQTFASTLSGPYALRNFGADPFVYANVRANDKPFTYLLTPRLRVSPDLMVYARFASGYRVGGPNSFVGTGLGLPEVYSPDKTQNYEVGLKGNLFGRLMSYDASVYYIDWKDLQLSLIDLRTRFGYSGNAGRAKSQGVELSLDIRPTDGLTITAWGAYNDAALTEAFPVNSPAFGAVGDRLPFSARWSGSFTVDQQFPLTDTLIGFVGGSISYMGERRGGFTSGIQAPQPIYPSYAQTDLRAGVKFGSWTVGAFATNLTDKRGLVSGDPALSPALYYIQPRTLGLNIGRTFD